MGEQPIIVEEMYESLPGRFLSSSSIKAIRAVAATSELQALIGKDIRSKISPV